MFWPICPDGWRGVRALIRNRQHAWSEHLNGIAVLCEEPVCCEKGDSLAFGLRDQQTIEGIFVDGPECIKHKRMTSGGFKFPVAVI